MRRRNNRVSVYLDDAELEKLRALLDRAGLTQQSYMRHLISGVVPADRPPVDYYAMMRELHAIGNNLNQIAHQANATGMVDASGYWRNVANLDETIAGIMAAVELPRKAQ